MDEWPLFLGEPMRLRLLSRRSRGSANAPRAPGPAASVTLRLATAEDDEAIARLAALYDRPIPSGPLLLAEVDGELQAALNLTGVQELMEPYLPTAALVELLALRAKHLRDQMTVRPATRRARPRRTTTPRTTATRRSVPASSRSCD
jgi:hypothetical protein